MQRKTHLCVWRHPIERERGVGGGKLDDFGCCAGLSPVIFLDSRVELEYQHGNGYCRESHDVRTGRMGSQIRAEEYSMGASPASDYPTLRA